MNFLSHRSLPMPLPYAPFGWIKIGWQAIQIQMMFEFEWATNPCATQPYLFVCHLLYTRKSFSCKLSTHKEAHALPFSRQEWIKIGWLAFEFKFDLNSSEQPLIFILSRGENAEKIRSCIVLKRREDRACAYPILERQGGVRKLFCMRKEMKRREKKRNIVGASFFGEYLRVSTQSSKSKKMSYECCEPTKFQKDLQHPLKHIC